MRTHISTMFRLIAIVGLLFSLAGCAATFRHVEPGCAGACDSCAHAKAAADRTSDAGGEPKADPDKLAEEEARDARKRAKLERDLAVARERVGQARMGQEHTAIEQEVAIGGAERELALETERLHVFTGRTAPNRIQQAELDLARAEDRAREAQEEIEQLEKMYAEDDFADGTKEIVLERGRRRLERSRESLRLQREQLAILTEKTIPLETAEHEWKVEQKAQALEKARRGAEAAALEKQIAVMNAEAEVARLEDELTALDEEADKRHKKQGRH
jgi:hypothetical protein